MKTNIALIGFMGTGKTAVGKVLAEKLKKEFVELDSLIVKEAGKTIPEIFKDGEIAFRELEIEAVKEVAGKKNQVIACGGGVVLNKINIDRLKQNAVIVLLTASPVLIWNRVKNSKDVRPLLVNFSGAGDIRVFMKSREPYYKSAADVTLDTSEFDVESVAYQVIEKVKEDANQNG